MTDRNVRHAEDRASQELPAPHSLFLTPTGVTQYKNYRQTRPYEMIQSVLRLASINHVRFPVQANLLQDVQTGSGDRLASYTTSTWRSFPRVKSAAVRDANHPSLSTPEVKNECSCNSTTPVRLSDVYRNNCTIAFKTGMHRRLGSHICVPSVRNLLRVTLLAPRNLAWLPRFLEN